MYYYVIFLDMHRALCISAQFKNTKQVMGNNGVFVHIL